MPLEDLHSASAVIFNWDAKLVASAILIISYLILFTEKLNRAVVALVGACIMIFAGVLTQETAIAGIDFNTLALLTGMMIIVGIAEKSGMFQYVAVWAVHRTRANPRSLLFTLGLAVLDAIIKQMALLESFAPGNFLANLVSGCILYVGLGGVGWLIGWLLHYAKESTHENKS